MAGRRTGRDGGHFSVLEAVIVALVVISGVSFVVSFSQPVSHTSGARANLVERANDALAVLAELPPGDQDAYESRLEELITESLQSGCDSLVQRLDRYFPPGVLYSLSLDNGAGELFPVCTKGQTPGERVTAYTIINPHWSNFYIVANVSQVSGAVVVDPVLGGTVDADASPLSFQGIVVRQSYIDSATEAALTFENGFVRDFNAYQGVRYTGNIRPEYRNVAGYQAGYDVPYATDTTVLDYVTTSTDVLQPVAEFDVTHNLLLPAIDSGAYQVHPKFTLGLSLANAVNSLPSNQKFQASKRDANHSESVQFTYNYDSVANVAGGVLSLQAGSVKIYNPVGVVVAEYPLVTTTGVKTYQIPRNALWGTYVARLEFTLADAGAGTVYLVNQLDYFNVNPPGWADKTHHIAPIYRVVLSVGYEDWV